MIYQVNGAEFHLRKGDVRLVMPIRYTAGIWLRGKTAITGALPLTPRLCMDLRRV